MAFHRTQDTIHFARVFVANSQATTASRAEVANLMMTTTTTMVMLMMVVTMMMVMMVMTMMIMMIMI